MRGESLMLNKTATRIATTVLYAAVTAVPLAIVTAPSAHAETPQPRETVQVAPDATPAWTKADKKLMKRANKTCKRISDDVTHEFCVIGAFHLNYAGPRVITPEDYTYGKRGAIVLLQADGTVA